MNKFHSNQFFLFIILATLFSCKPAAHIQVLQPAQIIVPEHINKILLVDRSKPSGGWLRNLESVFTGEELNQDQTGRRNAMDALCLLYTSLQIIDDAQGISVYPNPTSNYVHIPRSLLDITDRIIVQDVSGKIIKNLGVSGEKINLHSLDSGAYIISFISKNQIIKTSLISKY